MSADGFFRDLISAQKAGTPRGIGSVCSANRFVLEAAMVQGAEDGVPVLVESTVNQVNQFGGYAGMVPSEFRAFVEEVADDTALSRDRVILGGDHLGPYPWRAESASEAMRKARDLVAASIHAGYAKIHLDASMPLGGDPVDDDGGLDPQVVAEREAELAGVAEAAFRESSGSRGSPSPPVYVIGSEVPPPGGIRSGEEAVPVTRVEDLLKTVSLCREAFRAAGLDDAWSRTCAVVAQPGVEFGEHEVHAYDREKASAFCRAARDIPGIILEGHSTDYQTPAHLRQLVEDGVAILKVGPALTFALRECFFGLESIERELLGRRGGMRLSSLADSLDLAMTDDPAHWAGYYAGDEEERRIARRYSYSDRSRYYWNVPAVREAVRVLLDNLARTEIPLPLLSQFLPLQYRRVRDSCLRPEPVALLRESVRVVLRDYSAAVRA